MTAGSTSGPTIGLTIGLIAGNGSFPLLFARAARARGMRVFAVGMRGETDTKLAAEVDQLTWVRVGQLGKMISAFERAGVTRAAMAGGVRKTRLFSRARPDLLGLRLLARMVVRRDDGLLRAVAAEFERRNIEIVDSTLYMPDALAPAGVLTEQQPTEQQWRDLRYGLRIAREIGKLDVGQTVVVKAGAVIALEAIEGTDACIARAGDLVSGAVAVKVAKPDQDLRFDLPAVGPRTIDSLAAAGITVLGVDAGRTLILDSTQMLEAANRRGIAIVGLSAADDGASGSES